MRIREKALMHRAAIPVDSIHDKYLRGRESVTPN